MSRHALQGSKWLIEDDMNLAELIHEGKNWNAISIILERNIPACKRRYSMLRFAKRMSGNIVRIKTLVDMKPLKGRN